MIRIECPSIGGKADNCNWTPRDGSVRDNSNVGLLECQKCSLVTHATDLSESVDYEHGTMHNWALGYGGTLPGPAADTIRRVIAIDDLSERFVLKKILDFGCGDGEMIEALVSTYETVGIEPDQSAREIASQKGLEVYESPTSAIAKGVTVDAVTLFHVAEHFYEPTQELQFIYRLLKPNGLLIIETPNANDALLTMYQNTEFQNFSYWSHHPMLHSHVSLDLLISRNKFKVIENQGVQRYNLNNHLYWLSRGLPGGHEIWKNALSPATIQSYSKDLVQRKQCDTIWMVAQKSG